jgi:hypothetical protein
MLPSLLELAATMEAAAAISLSTEEATTSGASKKRRHHIKCRGVNKTGTEKRGRGED